MGLTDFFLRSPFTDATDARDLAGDGKYAEAVDLYDKSISRFEKAIHDRPGYMTGNGNHGYECFAWAYAWRGVSLANLGRIDEALDSVERAMKFGSDNAEVHEARAIVFMIAELIDESLESINIAISIAPKTAHFYGYKAMFLFLNGEHADARAYVEKAIEMDPDDPQLRIILDEINSGPLSSSS